MRNGQHLPGTLAGVMGKILAVSMAQELKTVITVGRVLGPGAGLPVSASRLPVSGVVLVHLQISEVGKEVESLCLSRWALGGWVLRCGQ